MRLGILGGTFDPPHVGHLLAASDAFDSLALDRLSWIPAGAQPLKQIGTSASGRQRLEMVRLTVSDDLRFAVDAIEIERDGLSFTVETLAAYAARFPDAERFFLIGEDVVPQLAQWREPARIATLASVIALSRSAEGASPINAGVGHAAVRRLETRRVDVSSTEIRARVRAGLSIRGFVSDAVADYINAAGLYR